MTKNMGSTTFTLRGVERNSTAYSDFSLQIPVLIAAIMLTNLQPWSQPNEKYHTSQPSAKQ
jgi:hypothetical protein